MNGALTENKVREILREELQRARVQPAFTDDTKLTFSESAAYLNISEGTIRNLTYVCLLIPLDKSARPRFYKSDLDKAYMDWKNITNKLKFLGGKDPIYKAGYEPNIKLKAA